MNLRPTRLVQPTSCSECGDPLRLVVSALRPEVLQVVCERGHEAWQQGERGWVCRSSARGAARIPNTEEQRRILASLVRHMSDAVIMTDTALNIVEYSGHAEGTYGWSRDEAIGRNLTTDFTVVFPDDDRADFHQRLAGGQQAHARMHARRKDGRWVDLDVLVNPLLDAADRLTGFLSVARDVTAEHRAEGELKNAHDQLSVVIDASDVGFWDWHIPSGRIQYSRRWAEMLGYDAADLEPSLRTWERLVLPDDATKAMALLDAHVRGDVPHFVCEQRLRHKNGHYVWVEARGRIVQRDTTGRPLRLAGIQTDITVRREAEQRMRRARRDSHAPREPLAAQLRDADTPPAGILHVCMDCQKIRDDDGRWVRVETYVSALTGAFFSHGLCPACAVMENRELEAAAQFDGSVNRWC